MRAIAFSTLTAASILSSAFAIAPARAASASLTQLAQSEAPAIAQNNAAADRARASLQKIKLPQGFSIQLYAMAPDARSLMVGPNGTVFVGTTDDKLYALRDSKGVGRADDVRLFAPQVRFRIPHGLCFDKDGALYVVEQNRVQMFPNAEASVGSATPDMRVLVEHGKLIPVSEESGNHTTRMCRVGPDGKLYISFGQPYNVPPADKVKLYDETGIGGVIRMNRDGSAREVFTRGIRNSVGMDFNPKDGTLWFTDNQVDGMGDDIPPGELNRQTAPGQHFGFPWYGGGKVRTGDYARSEPPKSVIFPQVEMDAHAADLGMTFYTGTMFPERYRNAIFSAQHGSWNRSVSIGARVMVTTLKSDQTADRTEIFAQGWRDPNGAYWGRPVDVAVLKDGSLLVSDDRIGAVYRITYAAK